MYRLFFVRGVSNGNGAQILFFGTHHERKLFIFYSKTLWGSL